MTDTEVQTLSLGIGQQLSPSRVADRQLDADCSHQVIQAGEQYATLSYSDPATRDRQLLRLCESCFTGQSRKRREEKAQRPAYTTATGI